ncbi:methionine adenosyltransferase 2 subunit beta-like [Oscarella lobularis]|uniref:methionine adenosyltransferase 2 subunit beta-like n=1 Tax=Oscarella lobularis TaxID=121494 RepID=UPI003313A57E
MSKKVLITGASGLLGRSLVRQFESNGWEVLGTAFSRATGSLRKVDLRDETSTNRLLDDFSPSIIVHSAAERRPDVVERNETETTRINVDATTTLAKYTAKHAPRTSTIYLSTDYVFDGTHPPYAPTDEPNPLNKYGISKLASERAAQRHDPSAIVLRVPVLYGRVETLAESAVTVLLDAVARVEKPAVMSDYERRYPTSVDDVAVVCRQIADKRLVGSDSVRGVYHWSGPDEMTKYDMAVEMAKLFDLPAEHVVANKEPSKGAPRPYNSQLDTSRLEELGIGQKTSFQDGILSLKENLLSKLG